MKRNKFAVAMGLALSLGLSAMSGGVYAEKVLKLGHLNKDDPFDNATGAMTAVFKNLVESGTNGSVIVQTFPNGQLGKDAEVLQQVKIGVVQSGIHSTGGFASVYPMIGVLDVPFAFPNISATYAVFDGPFGAKLAADIEAKTGMKVLGFGDSGGFFNFTNSRRPVKTLEDFKGLKIRTMGLDTHKKLVSSLGGQPAGIAWSEVYTALQTGVADGQMNPVLIIAFAKFNEVQKYLTLSGHLFTPYVWVMNADFWNSLDANEQSVVSYAAKICDCCRAWYQPHHRSLRPRSTGARQGSRGVCAASRREGEVPGSSIAGDQGAHRGHLRCRGRGDDERLP